MTDALETLKAELGRCTLCADRFAATATAHAPRPVVWLGRAPRILVAGQAPGIKVHETGTPFLDASGDRLRDWMGIGRDVFYDLARISVLPMAFCFPGYDANGSDLPPPPLCRRTWHDRVMAALGEVPLILTIGGYSQKYFLGAAANGGVTKTVMDWRAHAPRILPLPHPSWRNTAWLKKNPWFEAELLPVLRARVRAVLDD